MAELAIKGHSTRGKEVIGILEMLGGINIGNLHGNLHDAYYFINKRNYIDTGCISECNTKQYLLYSLEEFEKKFPYKVGDKVIDTKTDRVVEIYKAHWSETNNRTY